MVRRTSIGLSLPALAALLTLVGTTLAAVQPAGPGERPTNEQASTPDQPAPPEALAKGDRVSIVADIGFVGRSVAGRWTPILVRVDPGGKPRSGTIVVEHVQDRSQMARIATPFAAVPGVPCVVPLLAVLPPDVQSVTITALDERQRPIATTTYSTNQSDAAAAMNMPMGSDVALILAPGTNSLPDAARAWGDYAARISANLAQGVFDDTRTLLTRTAGVRWTSVLPARVVIEDLPTVARGYDGLVAVVMPDDNLHRVDPRAIDAMHEWVRQGGQLVILASSAGQQWTRLLPPELAGVVTLGPTAAREPGPGLRALLDEASRSQTPTPTPAPAPFPGAPLPGAPAPPAEAPEAVPTAEPGSTFIARAIALSDDAAKIAWATDPTWTTSNGSALVARGPVGLGMVAIVTTDPVRLWSRSTPFATGALWQTILHPQLASWNAMIQSATYANQQNWMNRGLSADALAINAAIESVVGVTGVGSGYLIILGSAMLALTLLVGPIDRLVLRRLGLSQFHWLSALGWVGLASLIAYILPRTVRTEPTRLQRVAVIDTIPVPLPGTLAPLRPHAAHSAVTSLYAAAAGSFPIISRDPSAWFHGIGPAQFVWGEPSAAPTSVFPTIQSTEPGAPGAPATRASRPDPVATGVWTLRCFADQAAAPTSPLRASITKTNSGHQVLIDGVPASARVTHAALQTRAGWYDLRAPGNDGPGVGTRDGTLITLNFPRSLVGPTPEHWMHVRPVTNVVVSQRANAPIERGLARPGDILNMPGPDRRQAALDAYLDTGAFAVLHLCAHQWPCEIDTPGAVTDQTTVLRIVLPLQQPEDAPTLIGPSIPDSARPRP